MLKHYVEFLGTRKTEEVAERNNELITVPGNEFAYRFFDRTEVVVDGETLVGERKNFSTLTYLGTEYTLEELKAQLPEAKNLIFNMEHNGWKRVVKTRFGNWEPLEEGDIVIS